MTTKDTREGWEVEFEEKFTKLLSKWKASIASPSKTYRMVKAVKPEILKSFISSLLSSERSRVVEEVRERVEKLAGQNTYEGEEALVYRTTMKEVLSLLNNKK